MFVYNTLTEAKDNPQNVRKYLQIISSDKGKYPKYVKNQSATPSPKKPMILQN